MIPLAALLIPAAIQAGLGIWQMVKGSQYAKTKRPEKTMPSGVTEAEALLKQKAYGDMPGYATQQQRLLGSGATAYNRAMQSVDSPAALLGYGSMINANTDRGLQDLYTKNAAYKAQGLGMLANFASGVKAQHQSRLFDWNEGQPYLNAMRTASMMYGGGMQNIGQGLSSGLNTYMQGNLLNELMEKSGGAGAG